MKDLMLASFEQNPESIKELLKNYTLQIFNRNSINEFSQAVYEKMQKKLTDSGRNNYFIGTVEATPTVEKVLSLVKAGNYKRVLLQPMMIVAGDHANNDMAGEEEGSWKRIFESAGYEVVCQVHGLGELEAIQNLFVEHTKATVQVLNG